MNRFAWLLAAGLLAVGSVALAQPGLIVDPWGAARPAANERPGDFRVTQRGYTFPSSSEVIDPWRVGHAAVVQASAPQTISGSEARPYAWPRAGEIIDPWASRERRRTPPRFDSLIVDPWAR